MVSRLDLVLKPNVTPLKPNVGPLQPNTPTQPANPLPFRKPLPAPTPDITLPPKLGRPPRAEDLIINRTFDGLTPDKAGDKIRNALQNAVLPENRARVDSTIKQRVRDMQVALNNVFTPGTPNATFLQGQQPAKLEVLGTMSGSSPVVYQVTKEGQPPRYYSKAWGGSGFTEMKNPPAHVVMRAEVTLEPRGIRMQYPNWEHKALSGKLTEITEL